MKYISTSVSEIATRDELGGYDNASKIAENDTGKYSQVKV